LIRFLPLVAIFFVTQVSASAILWPDSKPAPPKNRFNYDRTQEARTVSNFWSTRKMGVGVATAGAYGLMGGVVDFRFHPQWSVDLGFGGGSHFQSYGFRVKKMLLLSSPLNPYIGLGFVRWERTHTRPFDAASVSPGYISSAFMSDADRRANDIDEKLVYGTLGLQYTFMQGSWAGYGLFIEALFMVSAEDFRNTPTASLGFNYFF
jgi:hypothetical protein